LDFAYGTNVGIIFLIKFSFGMAGTQNKLVKAIKMVN
jgi:CRISPR/Cas system CSM-associated protein Csm4 (group 5 of RAMP superfamily)